jgi:hypothetical protein
MCNAYNLRHRSQLLPVGRLPLGDAKIGECFWTGALGAPVHSTRVLVARSCLRLLCDRLQLAGPALRPEPDLAGAALRLWVFRKAKVVLEGHGLVSDSLGLGEMVPSRR